ncbi:unnamed protein product [Prunus brigantina]
MKTQFNAQIQILRSDNGGEFINHDFQTYFQQHGIIHETTCPQTPEQNGVAERKNRHLLETARALLIGTHVPRHYWDDAIVTAVHLINRMPSGVLTFKTPLQVLAQHKPLPSQNWSNLENEEILICTEMIDRPESGARDYSLPTCDQLPIHNDQLSDLPDPCEDISYSSLTPTDNTEQQNEDPLSNSTVPTDQSPENILEVTTPTRLVHLENKTIGYQLPFRQNRGKPPNRYSPDIGKTSKYPIANHVSTEKLS